MDYNKLLDHIKSIELTKVQDDSMVLSDDSERVLDALLEAEQFINEAKEKLKERFLEVAKQNPKLKKYEGSLVSVGYRAVRRKVIKGNPDKAFYVVEKKPNTKAIDAYREAKGELPVGIEESMFEYITFKKN